MKRTALNLLIDLLAATFFVGMIATGYILRFPLPPGTNKSLSLWGLTRHQWGEVHVWISLGLLAILLTHLALHWQWVVTMVARQLHLATTPQSRHLRSGLIALAVLTAAVGLFGWVTEVSVRERDDSCCPPGEVTGTLPSGNSASGATYSAAERGKVSFLKDVYPVLETSCLSCHGPQRARGGFRVDRRADYFGKNGEALVVPGKCADSPLITIVSGQRPDMAMAARHKLPEHEVEILRAWIEAGAEWPEKRDVR